MEPSTTTLIVLRELSGHGPATFDPVQRFIMAHYGVFETLWTLLWFITAAALLMKLWFEYKRQKKNT